MGQQSVCKGVATSVFCKDGRMSVIYHNTLVVDVTPERIVLDSGGWQTSTTKTRMNQASRQFDLGYQVYAKARKWLVDFKGQTFEFVRGMELIR